MSARHPRTMKRPRIRINTPKRGERSHYRIVTSRDRLKALKRENSRRFSGVKPNGQVGAWRINSSRRRYSGGHGGELSPSALPRWAGLDRTIQVGFFSMVAHAQALLNRPIMLSKRQLRAAKES